MRRSKLIGTTMTLSLAIVMSGAITGCGNKQEQSNVEAVAVVEETAPVETVTAEEPTSVVETAVDEETTETAIEPETTEIEETTVPSTDIASGEEAFEPYTMYTNTACNIRDRASKDGILVGTYPVNTKIEVIGEENGWSKFIYDDGGWAFIKSSLLSKTQVAGKAVSEPKQETDSTPAQQPTPQPSPQPQASADTSQFPPDVAQSKYLKNYLGLGLPTETIIAWVREDEKYGVADGTETFTTTYEEPTPEEKAANAELSKNVVVE